MRVSARRVSGSDSSWWRQWAAVLVLMIPGGPISSADDAPTAVRLEAYRAQLDKTRASLDAGRIAKAAELLAKTEKPLRKFEYQYLSARLAAGKEGLPAPDLIQTLPRPDVEVRYAVLHEQSRQVVFLCRDGSLRIYDLAHPTDAPRIVRHPQDAAIWSGGYSHDGKRFFSGHQTGEVFIWDADKWEVIKTVPLGEAWPVRELAAAPDGMTFVAEAKSDLQLWSLADAEPKKLASVGERYTFGEGLAFSAKGGLLATGGMFDIHLHDARSGKKLRSLNHASYTMGLEFSPDGRRIASAPRGNVNRLLAVFDVASEKPLFNAGPFNHYVAGMAFTPDGGRIAATGCEKVVRVFDSSTGVVLLPIRRTECSAKPAFTRDGRLLGWSEPAGFVYIDLGEEAEEQPTPKP